MPTHIKRLIFVFAFILVLMLFLKYYFTPKSFGEYGHYRAAALKEIAEKEPKYADAKDCAMCHDSIANLKSQGEHKSINCQTCHGPGYLHENDPSPSNIEIPQKENIRKFCTRCHAKNASRPQNVIRQVDAIEHNKGEVCITCHNPHNPWL